MISPIAKQGLISLPLFIAESSTDSVKAGAIGELLVSLAALAVLVGAIWNMIDRIKGGTPQKNEISFAAQFATAQQLGDLKREVDKIDHERRTSAANLHKKIEDLGIRLDDRIDEIPKRTISLLSETKQLHAVK